MNAPVKSNKTPDLSDDEYMEQLHMMAQGLTTMPGATPQHPNVTTPAPIRSRWAAYLISIGFRLDPELATHKLVRTSPVGAGNHSPHELRPLKREDMWQIVKETSPELYEKYQRGEATLRDFEDGIGANVMDAVRQAMAAKQREEKGR